MGEVEGGGRGYEKVEVCMMRPILKPSSSVQQRGGDAFCMTAMSPFLCLSVKKIEENSS